MDPWQIVLLSIFWGLAWLWMEWRTIEVVSRFRPGVQVLVFLADTLAMAGTGFLILPFGFIGWRLWLFWTAARWEPYGGMFAAPPWPRNPLARGRRNRLRQFREPLPWGRGPFTY